MIDVKPKNSFSPTLVKQYAYCPVIGWLQWNLGVVEPPTDSMRIGREDQQGGLRVSSSRGATVLDRVEEESGHVVLVERKTYVSRNYSRYVEQTLASYLVAREKIPHIRKIRVETPRKTMEIEVSGYLLEEIESLVAAIESKISSEKPPRPGDLSKCFSCWYKRFCPYG